MAKFVYIYSGGKMPETPEEGQQFMAAWGAWAGGLGAAFAIGAIAAAVILCGIAFQAQPASAAPQEAAQDMEGKALMQKAKSLCLATLKPSAPACTASWPLACRISPMA